MTKVVPRQYFSSLIVIILLFFISRLNFLLFHTLAEVFSIVIIFAVFMFTWNTRKYMRNNYLLFIGIAFIFFGFIDILHTFTYKGINILFLPEKNITNYPTQLWIAARYMQSISLLIAPFFLNRKINISYVILAFHLIVIAVVLSIFYWHNFPDCYLDGIGLTPFKKVSEYIISFILIGSIFTLWKHKDKFEHDLMRLITLSILATIFSELAFTFYIGVFDFSNMIGHLLKIVAFFLIYKAIIVAGLQQPVEVLFHDLNLSRKKLLEHKDKLEAEIKKAVTEVEERNKMLILQSRHAQLGEMIAAITHQWKQPLNQISVLSTAMIDAWNYNALDQEFLERSINNISSVVNDMNDILNDFRNFYAPQISDVDFELADVIKPLQALVGRRLEKYNIELKLDIKSGLILNGKINEIIQVFLILINNAVDAISESGVKIGKIFVTSNIDENNITVTVRDNAGGIDLNIIDNLFQPYFTTKGDKGTGMGLFLARTIIEKHFNGTISVRNHQDGAEFTCFFRRSE